MSGRLGGTEAIGSVPFQTEIGRHTLETNIDIVSVGDTAALTCWSEPAAKKSAVLRAFSQ